MNMPRYYLSSVSRAKRGGPWVDSGVDGACTALSPSLVLFNCSLRLDVMGVEVESGFILLACFMADSCRFMVCRTPTFPLDYSLSAVSLHYGMRHISFSHVTDAIEHGVQHHVCDIVQRPTRERRACKLLLVSLRALAFASSVRPSRRGLRVAIGVAACVMSRD